MDIDQYNYALPASLIAQYPNNNRSSSRLLVVGRTASYQDMLFNNILDVLRPGDMLVVNDTRVLPARMIAKKPTGGKVEIMLERMIDDRCAWVLLGSNKAIRDGQVLMVGDYRLVVSGRKDQFFRLQFPGNQNAEAVFQQWGCMPLPPYITRQPTGYDTERYQTVYAKNPGAAAAPTAGLHFDKPLIDRIKRQGVGWGAITLHIGAGTFQPVRCQDVQLHRMYGERFQIDNAVCTRIARTRARGGKIIAVGTTVVRALESAAQSGNLVAGAGETELFILPGYKFKVVDGLITNFHLPKSTLLMLVSAFAGHEKIRAAYQYAIDKGYRFFSYGDAMYLLRQ